MKKEIIKISAMEYRAIDSYWNILLCLIGNLLINIRQRIGDVEYNSPVLQEFSEFFKKVYYVPFSITIEAIKDINTRKSENVNEGILVSKTDFLKFKNEISISKNTLKCDINKLFEKMNYNVLDSFFQEIFRERNNILELFEQFEEKIQKVI